MDEITERTKLKKFIIAIICRFLRPYEVLKLHGVVQRAGVDLQLHFGSGGKNLHGWMNVDYNFRTIPDVILDLTRPIPLKNNCARFIYSEDFIEHIPFASGQALLKECHRLLALNGVLRILTPDLGRIATQYIERDAGTLEWYAKNFNTKTAGQMLNAAMREMEHCFLYDVETMVLALKNAGFEEINQKSFGESGFEPLRGLDRRKGSLILEAVKNS